jgi:protein TonB
MKVNGFFLLGMAILTSCTLAQTRDSTETDKIFIDPLTYASFPGGQVALTEYIAKNFNWTHGQLTVQGSVFVEFLVDVDGKIKDAKVLKGLCESCDKEALRLVKSMPSWIPASMNGNKVEMKFVLPVKFGP